MINKGRHQHRFAANPLERAFAEAWETMNLNASGRSDGQGILDWLLVEDPKGPMGEVTDRDREVAATVIQWLGSHVGEIFVMDALRTKYGQELAIRPKKG